jgi:hypothetical protein
MLLRHIARPGSLDAIVNADRLRCEPRSLRFKVYDAEGHLIEEGDLLDALHAHLEEGDVIFDARTDRVLASR